MKQMLKIVPFFAFPVGVLFAHLIMSRLFLDLYTRFPRLDIPVHYLGGLSIAYTSARILSYLEDEKITGSVNPAIFLVLTFALTATATVFWEFMEFAIDRLLDSNIQVSLANTMQDQLMGLLGGATLVLLYSRKLSRGRATRFGRM